MKINIHLLTAPTTSPSKEGSQTFDAHANRNPVPLLGGVRGGFPRHEHAFTLVEMLLVLVIIGVLAAIVIPKIAGRGEDARKDAAKAQISAFGTALDMFEVDNGYYPKGKDGLRDLVQTPAQAPNWKGPYLKQEIPADPWGNAYNYECPGKYTPSGYDLSSPGPDGRAGTEDDITSWSGAAPKK